MPKDNGLYRIVSVHNSENWWPRNRKSLGSWLGHNRGFWRKHYRIERAAIMFWEDVTEEFKA